MQKLWKLLAVVAFMFITSTPAMAQATRTWVSGVGDDANPCSRTAPCKTFAGAISKTAENGEINCIDPGGFGGVTITKAITISCPDVEAGVLVSGTNAIIINAGTTDRVVLRGLDIEGLTTGLNGVNILSAGDVLIEDCVIHGFNAAPTNGNGVLVNSGAVATRVTVSKSTISSNTKGVSVVSTGGTSQARVYDSLVTDNSQAGLSVDGTGNVIVLMNNRIFGPSSLQVSNGGVTKSYGGNYNSSGNPPTTTAAPQ